MPISDTDGQYYLKVNTDSLYFYKEGRERLLSIHSDHPDGWSLEIDSSDIDWVTASLMSANTGTKDETFIECDDYTPVNSVETHREGYITIKAGRIRRNIKIYQVAEPELTIEVSPELITFRKSGASPKSVTVKVYPETSNIFFDTYQPPGTSAMSWVPTTGFPESGYPWLSPGTYSFQPLVNNSDPAKILSTVVNVSIVGSDGKSITKQVTLRQLADDLLFKYTPDTPFPAAGGSATVYVDSDTDWWVYGKDDADGVIATWHDTRYEAGTGTPYTFELSSNDSWSPRTGKLSVMSTDDDFAGDFIIVDQEAPKTSLTTNPANGQKIEFGNAASPGNQNVKVISNATWTLTKGSNFADVASVTVTSGGSHTYNTTGENTVQFTPSSWAAATTTPAAGTLKTTTATFTTTNHSPAGASSSQITLTRAVPALWSKGGLVDNTVTASAGGDITVNASSNAAWNIKATGSGGETMTAQTGSVAANTYATRQAKVTIPANKSWNSRSITVIYEGAGSGTVGTYTQTGYKYDGASLVGDPSFPPGKAGSATIKISGWYPNTAIQARRKDNGAPLGSATVLGGTANQQTMSIDAYNGGWDTRTVILGYVPANNTSGFVKVGGEYTQSGYKLEIVSNTLARNGRSLNGSVTFKGTFPEFSVMIQIGTNGNGQSVKIPATTDGTRTLSISGGSGTIAPNQPTRVSFVHPDGVSGTVKLFELLSQDWYVQNYNISVN